MSTKLLLMVAMLVPACGARPTQEEHFEDRPAALVDLELTSEHAYARALAGDVAEVTTDSARALEDWTRLRGDARRRGGGEDLLAEMDAAVLALGNAAASSTDPIELGRAANRITGSLDDVFALYDPAVRSGVMVLDYLGRELYLDGKAEDLRHAGTHASMLGERWSALRPSLQVAGSDQLAMFDASIAAIDDAVSRRDTDDLSARAVALVDQVDAIERGLAR